MEKLSKYNADGEEITVYEFISHTQDYIRNLLDKPGMAQPDQFLQSFGLTGPILLKSLLDANVLNRRERIVSPKTPEDGNKDKFSIKYSVNRENYRDNMRKLYRDIFSNKWVNESRMLREEGEGAMGGATSAAACNDSAPEVPFGGKKGRTIIITKEQAEWLAEALLKEDCPAEMDTKFGNFGYDAPGMSIKKKDPTMDHSNIMANGWNNGE